MGMGALVAPARLSRRLAEGDYSVLKDQGWLRVITAWLRGDHRG